MILSGRNMDKLKQTEDDIKQESSKVTIALLELDLSSQASVRKAAKEINEKYEVIDRLINNAGIMATAFKLSPE